MREGSSQQKPNKTSDVHIAFTTNFIKLYYMNSITGERRDFTFDMITFCRPASKVSLLLRRARKNWPLLLKTKSVMSNQICYLRTSGLTICQRVISTQ